MKMKTIEKMMPSTVMVYIAEDGKEFDNERDCERYEKKLKLQKLADKINTIKNIYETPPYTDDYHGWRWFYIENAQQVNDIVEYYNSQSSYNDMCISIESFPQWICIEEGDYGEAWYYGTLTEYKKGVNEFLKIFDK